MEKANTNTNINTNINTDNKNTVRRNKITLYINADDTILRSSETIINLLSQKHKIFPKKSIRDLHEDRYRSIYGHTTIEEIDSLFESDDFFDNVKIDGVFLRFYKTNRRDFNFVIIAHGTEKSLLKKENFLKRELGNGFEFVGIPFCDKREGGRSYDKSAISMKRGVHIDNRTDSLTKTAAPIKILYKHDIEVPWNNGYENLENFYVVNTWKEIVDILVFVKEEHFLFTK